MGAVKTLTKSEKLKNNYLDHTLNSNRVNQLLDEIIIRFSDLIMDVEMGNIKEFVLKQEIEKIVDKEKGIFNPENLKIEIFNTLFGYGPLQKYIEDDSVSDIDATRFDYILVTRAGVKEKIVFQFDTEENFERFCKLLIIRNGGMINEVDSHCRVSDIKNHLRINVAIKPRNVTGTSLNIRKHAQKTYTLDYLEECHMMTENQKAYLRSINKEKKNIIICGKGAAGKTTLLKALIDDVDEMERMLICESDVEIYPQSKNVIGQCIKKKQVGGSPRTLQNLIADGLTMSLDTYCIGELTGSEAWAWIQAGHTDHRILGTIHSSSAQDVFLRLLTLIESETRLSEIILYKLIAESIHVIIYLNAFKIKEIVEVKGVDSENNGPVLKKI